MWFRIDAVSPIVLKFQLELLRMRTLCSFLTIMLLSVSVVVTAGTISDSAWHYQVPYDVIKFVSKKFSDMYIPDISRFKKIHKVLEKHAIYSKESSTWPPYCIQGDFNGDRLIDYALILAKDDTVAPKELLYLYRIFILHRTKQGFRVVYFGNNLGGRTREISTSLYTIKPGKYKRRGSHKSIILSNDTVGIIEDGSILYLRWNGKRYVQRYIYAD